MTYRINQYRYVLLVIYALSAISLSVMAERDVLMLLNLAVVGAIGTYFLIRQELLLLSLAILAAIFSEGITQFNMTYVIFFLYGLMLFSIVANKSKNKVNNTVLAIVAFSFIFSLIPSLVNGTSIPLLIMASLKRYGFLIIFLYALNIFSFKEKYKKFFDMLILLVLPVNFLFAFLQYIGGELTQDSITGFMGEGTTGILIYLFMFYLAIASGLHHQKKISTGLYAALAVVPLVYSAIAEVKIGFISTAIILLVYLVFINRGFKAFLLLVVAGFALSWFYSFFVSIYPEHDFMSRNFLQSYLVDQSYGAGATLNRFGFKPTIDAMVFSGSQNEILFGKGLGSGNPSDTEFLQGDVYREYGQLKYDWFVLPYLYIENGMLGTFFFLLIYFVPLLYALKEFLRRGSEMAVVLFLMGVTNLIFLPYNVGLFSYGVTAIYWVYFAMLLHEKQEPPDGTDRLEDGIIGKQEKSKIPGFEAD